ncbi:MAG: DUF4399 domain-containing protein [Xanthomonadales bacterium]|nr:DUF4399 domain-containing protein [Xanthomonadales bacterium]
MNRILTGIVLLVVSVGALGQGLTRSTAPEGARVYFITPVDGAVVRSPVHVQFGLAGMGVAPAGTDAANTGHHHLLIDLPELPPADVPLPANDQVRHFGGGQTEAMIDLEPGEHTLQLIMGNHLHVPHDPVVASERITITVKE